MASKIFRDPLYNYISIDLNRDAWLLPIIESPEFQRLRRIHQLGVSAWTYPGAEHSRLNHSLGVMHLMHLALEHLKMNYDSDSSISNARTPLLAAALLHDIGHGPYSHLFEEMSEILFGKDPELEHERYSQKVILDESGDIYKALSECDPSIPSRVAGLLAKQSSAVHPWQAYLLSSQLDVDRMDYLRRDSLFTGAGYGHFDYYRLINCMELSGSGKSRDVVWPAKAKLAVEEFILSRYYMYQNVYLHKTTRCFEAIFKAAWVRAKSCWDASVKIDLIPVVKDFFKKRGRLQPAEYLSIEEHIVLHQFDKWMKCNDEVLARLSRSFLCRKRFKLLNAPPAFPKSDPAYANDFEDQLKHLFHSNGVPEDYLLKDSLKAKYNQPYIPEREGDLQTARNAIRIAEDGSVHEVSRVLPRLRPLMATAPDLTRYFVPPEIHPKAEKLCEEYIQS